MGSPYLVVRSRTRGMESPDIQSRPLLRLRARCLPPFLAPGRRSIANADTSVCPRKEGRIRLLVSRTRPRKMPPGPSMRDSDATPNVRSPGNSAGSRGPVRPVDASTVRKEKGAILHSTLPSFEENCS